MNRRDQGNISGSHYDILELQDIVVTDTAYIHEKVDWHCHEHPYFTFLLQGKMKEISSKNSHLCTPGTLIFHYSGDTHYNLRMPEYTRGFHIELNDHFFGRHHLSPLAQGKSEILVEPHTKLALRRLFAEQKIKDEHTQLAFDEQLLKIFGTELMPDRSKENAPAWVRKIKEVLNDAPAEELNFQQLASVANVHAVYLSRAFPKYFNTSASNYIRNLKLERALNQLTCNRESLSQLAYQYGFADQSHFIRWFRTTIGITPKQYQKIISAG